MRNNYYNKNFGELKLTFDGFDTIDEFYSQAGQDIFTICVLNGKRNGKFLDIGASDPKIINNTYLLETLFGWSGTQIEIDNNLANKCRQERNTNVICNDATKVDYNELYLSIGEIDYLSLDIDGPPTLEVLEKIPFDKFKIKVITFEHDSYKEGDHLKNESRRILGDNGYFRICTDVANDNNVYEDWYVNLKLVNVERLKVLESNNKNWNEILF